MFDFPLASAVLSTSWRAVGQSARTSPATAASEARKRAVDRNFISKVCEVGNEVASRIDRSAAFEYPDNPTHQSPCWVNSPLRKALLPRAEWLLDPAACAYHSAFHERR